MENMKLRYKNYLLDKVKICNEEEAMLLADMKKDEANLCKIRANIYNIGNAVLNVLGNTISDKVLYAEAYIDKLNNISSQWRISLEKARQFDDVEKILIEEIKLETAEEMIYVIKKMAE